MTSRLSHLIVAAGAALTLSACATYYDDYHHGYGDPYYGPQGADYAMGDYAYDGEDYAYDYAGALPDEGLEGPGVELLDPWLRHTVEGRHIVALGFRDAGHGYVDEDVAHRANIWFRRYADSDRDMRLTDPEIRIALVQAARDHGY